MSGKIEMMYGPMFSQKTMWLVHICLGKMADLDQKCLLLLHSYDIRPELSQKDIFSTHSNLREGHEKLDIIKTSSLSEIDVSEYSHIGIDEGQFFSKKDIKIVISWFKQGKTIYVSALDGDFKRNFFGYTYMLIPYVTAGCLHKSPAAVCSTCLKRGKQVIASYTYKHTMKTSQVIDPGASDKYIAVCEKCFVNN